MLDKDFPEIYMITKDDFEVSETLISKVELQLKNGIKLVQLRIKQKKKEGYEFYANELFKVCNKYSAKLTLNHSLKSFPDIPCFGIHITSKELMETRHISKDIRKRYKISAPVHNYQELEKANELKLDFAILTPIQKTNSHPDGPYIGWKESTAFLKKTDIPMYAAGGMNVSDLQQAKDFGFVGVACLGALWG